MSESNIYSNHSAHLLYAVSVGYKATKTGKVISSRGITLRLRIDSKGYLVFYVRCNALGIKGPVPVHRLIAYQKFGEKIFNPKIQVRHKNNNKLDNRYSNIKIGSGSQNLMDCPPDERLDRALNAASYLRCLSYHQARQLRKDRNAGMTYKMLMKKYHIAKSTVSYIVNNKTYKETS